MGDTRTDASRPTRRGLFAPGIALLLALALTAGRAEAQGDSVEDVFGGFGTVDASQSETGAPAPAARAGEGTIVGQVFDADSGAPVAGVTVIVTWPPPADGSEPKIEVKVTDAGGAFEFPSVPEGSYTVAFSKSGYRPATMNNFAVQAGQLNRADFPLPPLPVAAAGQVLQLDAFVVEAETVGEMMNALEIRMDSDLQLNIMSAEDFAKFAAGDVADALKRVAGVNVVEGRFAIIRGLEDRYSSTLYNSAVVPSPDPDRQSVQLDLFPSEVVGNLVVAKTFAPELPSNSSGGSLDVGTFEYPPGPFEFKIKAGAGFNENAIDRFIELAPGSPVGKEEGIDPVDLDFGATLGGRVEFLDREIRYKGVFNWEREFQTQEGFQHTREPSRPDILREGRPGERVRRSGSLALGELNLSGGRFDLTQSEQEKQLTGYGGLGFDLDREGFHQISFSGFYTQKEQEVVEYREDGYLPGFDYERALAKEATGTVRFEDDFRNPACRPDRSICSTLSGWIANSIRDEPQAGAARGPVWFTNFQQSRSFDTERDLLVLQLNGDHEVDPVPGLGFRWAGNYARTTQEETALGARIFYEPESAITNDPIFPSEFPSTVDQLGPGDYAVNGPGILLSANDIEEDQWFGRLDIDYERTIAEMFDAKLTTGGWYEDAKRDVESRFLQIPQAGGSTIFAIRGATPFDLGRNLFSSLDQQADGFPAVTRDSLNDSKRQIWAWHVSAKTTFWDRVDLLGGVRLEKIEIESNNDPFTDDLRFGAPATYPEAYLFLDRRDNVARGEVSSPIREGTVFNDEILGIDVPIDPETGLVDLLDEASISALIDGRIDEFKALPTAGFAVRPLQGLSIRGSWSQTVARPSFREMGFYASVELGTDDLTVGNPQLDLSDVRSFDTRVEYVWGELGDLIGVSAFYKYIEDPIESILLRDPINPDTLWRTWFNNPDEATLWGIEVEARKYLDFIGLDFGEYLSIGGNFTYIDAEVDRTEAELRRAEVFFRVTDADQGTQRFTGLKKSRRLFGQPEWIANADISFDHPDWGTKMTLAFFAISDVLDAAGTSSLAPGSGVTESLTLDRYVDSFHTLDLIVSQRLWAGFSFKATFKNLTDSRRRILYDTKQLAGDVPERSVRVGRDFKFTITWTFF
ncbi:MAG: TonB-dependent receptor [Myxococcota bacterium]|nr:TonB-dependent receptor [Myxococcota bacterium]